MNNTFWEFIKETTRDYFAPIKKAWFWILLISFLITIIMMSCVVDNVKKEDTEHKLYGSPVTVLEIEGCEYLEFYNGARTHKGNCKNPIHNCSCTCETEEEVVIDEATPTLVKK